LEDQSSNFHQACGTCQLAEALRILASSVIEFYESPLCYPQVDFVKADGLCVVTGSVVMVWEKAKARMTEQCWQLRLPFERFLTSKHLDAKRAERGWCRQVEPPRKLWWLWILSVQG